MIESSEIRFSNNKEIEARDAEEVVMRSIERLLERDSPQLETIKMQVFYDQKYSSEERGAQKLLQLRGKSISTHIQGILELGTEHIVDDFEALTKLYRLIFRFLLDFAPNPKIGMKAVDKEVAAALESVFPRVGLKAFVSLSEEDKRAQLIELGRIVTGIRLLNKYQSKLSGSSNISSGLDDLEAETDELGSALIAEIDIDKSQLQDECIRYHSSIMRSNLQRGKERGNTSKAVVDRWAAELTNKRQFCCLQNCLLEEIQSLYSQAAKLSASLVLEKDGVKSLVTGKASVPKEEVYPRFNTMGALYLQLYEVKLRLRAKRAVYTGLLKFRNTFQSTLFDAMHPLCQTLSAEEEEESFAVMKQQNSIHGEDTSMLMNMQGLSKKTKSARSKMGDDEERSPHMEGEEGGKEEEVAEAEEKAMLLSIHTTPDFLTLPLEFQGYCPWTLVHSRGLLAPGRPGLGVIQYQGAYFVCDQEAGVKAFMANPSFYLASIRSLVLSSPEYIHLLRLQRWFPNASISLLSSGEVDGERNYGGRAACRDAATETPMHFTERHIDVNYHWNEWDSRRKGLQLIKLQNCATSAQQTDDSHFRRDNETMLYIQRHNWSQTKRSKATNPPIKTCFVAGLRGKVGGKEKQSVSQFIDVKTSLLGKEAALQPRVVTLTLDL